MLNKPDVYMAVVLVAIVGMLIIPLSPFMIDVLLVVSIGISLLILVITTQLEEPLQLSSFPSLLLMVTLFRMALNVATTRQILLSGFGGNIIQAFGDYVVGGNYIVGCVVFLILVVINFMVITKGSGRIAEVAARFTLDAMPGKQMSIDADLNSGLIDEKTAIERRKKLSRESDFFGAMDGASKFVRGDAVAGIIITLINVIGGFAVGMLQRGMSAGDALSHYTLLTIGDGLVTQIPALIISTSAGMIVTRAASDRTLGMEVGSQLFMRAKPMMITGCLLGSTALLPGMPFVPFMLLGAVVGATGYGVMKSGLETKVKDQATQQKVVGAGKEGGKQGLLTGGEKKIPGISLVDLEIGFGLVQFVDNREGGKLIDRIAMVRGQLAEELGMILPPVNVRDNIKLKNTEYSIRIRGLEVARGFVRPGQWLAINPGNAPAMEGLLPVKEPAFGFDAYWLPSEKKDFAEGKGYTVVDCTSVITTHLAEMAKRAAADILTRQDVSNMIDQVKETAPSVVQELVPAKFPVGGIHRVLQRLLAERVSIRDLPLILESISDHIARTQDPVLLSEFCRKALGGHICLSYVGADGTMAGLSVHPNLETLVKKSVRREGNDAGMLIMDPSLAKAIVDIIKTTVQSARSQGLEPAILCSPIIRVHLRHLIEHELSSTPVISFAEVPDAVSVNMIGFVQAPAIQEAKAILQEA